jgi:collagenase-like PrtC family protease
LLFALWAFPSGVVAAGVAVVYAAFEAGVAYARDGLFTFIAGLTEGIMLLHERQFQVYFALNCSRR